MINDMIVRPHDNSHKIYHTECFKKNASMKHKKRVIKNTPRRYLEGKIKF